MNKIEEILHNKRKLCEDHIKKLQEERKEGIRYTIMMKDIHFLILGLLNDVGWIIYLISLIIYFCKNNFHFVFDYIILIIMIFLIFSVFFISYLNKIHEKEIDTKLQKNLSFGLLILSGLMQTLIGIIQAIICKEISIELILIIIGSFINFVTGLPIYLSFKKGIYYGIK